jgi:hypothetical protein
MLRFFAALLLILSASQVMAADGAQSGTDGMVKADVLYWEGEELVVKEMSGHELRIRVTPNTKIVGVISRLKAGDKIHAAVLPDGSAQSITLQVPDSGPPVPATVR